MADNVNQCSPSVVMKLHHQILVQQKDKSQTKRLPKNQSKIYQRDKGMHSEVQKWHESKGAQGRSCHVFVCSTEERHLVCLRPLIHSDYELGFLTFRPAYLFMLFVIACN